MKRRQLLAAALGMGILSSQARAQTTGPSSPQGKRRAPGAVGGKFYPTGQVREWPGNTIICPVGSDTPLHEMLRSVQEEAMAEPVMRKFTIMPTSSLHMTLFDGVDLDHRRAPYWPTPVPLDAPLAAADMWCAEQLQTFHTGGGRFRMRPDVDFNPPEITDFAVRLDPADLAQATQLKMLRNRLSDCLHIRAPGHDGYRFHITLGYLIDWLTPDEMIRAQKLYRRWLLRIAEATPEFVIGQPAFCTFRDMFAFTPVVTLME